MGATGSGKSTFINLISGSNLGIDIGTGRSSQPLTEAVQTAGPFSLDNRRVVLFEFPGLNDVLCPSMDQLKTVATFLETSYKQGTTLTGVLYFHRISGFRHIGSLEEDFGAFRELCGEEALKNVVIVANVWSELDLPISADVEAELAEREIFFKPVLDKGARMVRYENTVPSAEAIIRLLLNNHPLPLRLQQELVDEHKDVSETGVGEELNRKISLNAGVRLTIAPGMVLKLQRLEPDHPPRSASLEQHAEEQAKLADSPSRPGFFSKLRSLFR